MDLRLANASDLPPPPSPRIVRRIAELRFVASFDPRTREEYEVLVRLVRMLARMNGAIESSVEVDTMS